VQPAAWRERDEKPPCYDDAEAPEGHSMRGGEPEVWAEGERRGDQAVEASAAGEMVHFMELDGLQPASEEMV
jgi:hypothetical protein